MRRLGGPIVYRYRLLLLLGFCLLGAAPLVAAGRARPARLSRGPGWPDGLGAATLLAASAAAIAAAIAIGWALNGGSEVEPAVVICGGVAALALVARVADLLRRERAAALALRRSIWPLGRVTQISPIHSSFTPTIGLALKLVRLTTWAVLPRSSVFR